MELRTAITTLIDMPALLLQAFSRRKGHHLTTRMSPQDDLTHLHTLRLRTEARLGEIRAGPQSGLSETERLCWISLHRLHNSLTRDWGVEGPPGVDVAVLVREAIRAIDRHEPMQVPCTTVEPEEITDWQTRGSETTPICLVRQTQPDAAEALVQEYMTRRYAVSATIDESRSGDNVPDGTILKELIDAATRATQMRRGTEVTLRDVNYGLRLLRESERRRDLERRGGRPPPSPSEARPPENREEMNDYLTKLKHIIDELVSRGYNRPTVVVVCERTQTIARAFQQAGCDVCTADLYDAAEKRHPDSASIPHFKGDCRMLIHRGFDMVVGCPPCKHLCLASIRYVTEFPERKMLMQEAADFLLELLDSRVAFGVALENPKHHPAAREALRGLRPTCICHPHQFGQPESKPTTWFMTPGLSVLEPTMHVIGRVRRCANLPPSVWRGDWRSEFYEGIALAAAARF